MGVDPSIIRRAKGRNKQSHRVSARSVVGEREVVKQFFENERASVFYFGGARMFGDYWQVEPYRREIHPLSKVITGGRDQFAIARKEWSFADSIYNWERSVPRFEQYTSNVNWRVGRYRLVLFVQLEPVGSTRQ